MFFLDLFTALIIASALAWLFYLVTGGKKQRKVGLFWVFVILFFSSWAGGVWIRPVGPAWSGIHWLSFLLPASIVALTLIIAIPRRAPRGRHETIDMLEAIEREREVEEAAYLTLSIFFWVLLILLLLIIIWRYLTGV